jgi:hypothetical protein
MHEIPTQITVETCIDLDLTLILGLEDVSFRV